MSEENSVYYYEHDLFGDPAKGDYAQGIFNKKCFGKSTYIRPLQDVLTLQKTVEVPDGDELGITVNYSEGIKLKNLCVMGRKAIRAADRRHVGGMVGFYPMDADWLKKFVLDLFNNSYTCARRTIIDTNEQLSKVVVVVFVMHKNEVILIPRYNKEILSDVFTTAVMESLVPRDISEVFDLDQLWSDLYNGGECLSTFLIDAVIDEVANHLARLYVEYPFLHRLPLRGIIEEFPHGALGETRFQGIVGGGKDIGLVYGIEVADSYIFQRICEAANGVTFNPEVHDYSDIATYWGGDIDGWSEAILKYVLK